MEVIIAVGLVGLAGLVVGLALPSVRRTRPPVAAGHPGTAGRPWAGTPRLAARVVEALHIGALVIDRHDRVVLANPTARTMGLLRGDALALNELRELARTTRQAGTAQQREVRLLYGWLPKEPAAVLAHATPAGPRGQVVLLVEDVTAARRVAQMRRDFVADVSHELKTPVGALALLAEALEGAWDDPVATRRFTERIRHESGRLTRLVTELIELSRLEAAYPMPERASVSIQQVLAEAVDRTRPAAAARRIDVTIDADPGSRVLGNHDQLVTAVVNLVDNAIVYSGDGGRVEVAARCPTTSTTEAPASVQVTVTDQGIGIADDDLGRIFERFYRADPARSRATGGTGLGLAIVKHVVTNHDGYVGVHSRPGQGSTFTLTLPATPPASGRTHAAGRALGPLR